MLAIGYFKDKIYMMIYTHKHTEISIIYPVYSFSIRQIAGSYITCKMCRYMMSHKAMVLWLVFPINGVKTK